MKIVGGRGIGADNDKTRTIEIEPGDVGKQLQVHCHPVADGGSEGNDLFITYYEDGPSGRMVVVLDDPVETAEPSAPFWVKPEPWERMLKDLEAFTREGIVNIVTESCLQGMVLFGWQGEARKRLLSGLAMGIKEVSNG